ncbi:hypothetical protein BCR42DRAFT_165436 [Absidia repens]|uniref:Membrane anchor Opy2 N-terminal domain-containing protein n=1 Tax=Absidia repens TaxID=90262 RepID=A0A1X2ITZ3_9FUNG|nr:hypothetical protein BCR42DRAFT_165436 [Absidia repens]
MSSCGQCPASKCMDKSALGISDNNSSNNSNSDQSENNDGLIGGLVGGLVGGGIFISALAFCIYRYRKSSKSTLPIAFQTTTRYNQQQQLQQQRRQRSMSRESNTFPRLSDVPRPMSESTRDSACHSITSGVIPIAYIPPSHHMQQEAYHQQSQLYRTTSPMAPHSNSSATPTTVISHSTTTTAVDNPFQDPRHSQYTVDDDEDDDDDMSSRHHSVISTNQQASHHAVQVTRAKPQILRVNTVRVNDLKRGNSVRTILTKSEEEEQQQQQLQHGDGLVRSNTMDAATLDRTNVSQSPTGGEQDPFQDDRYTVDDNDDLRSSRPITNHSMGSTLGDGEITIFWSGQQPSSFTSNQQQN